MKTEHMFLNQAATTAIPPDWSMLRSLIPKSKQKGVHVVMNMLSL